MHASHRFVFASLLSLAGLAAGARGNPAPIEDLVRAPQMSRVVLSPDGEHAATIVADKGFRGLLIYDLQGKKPLAQRGKREFMPSRVDWMDNKNIIFYVARQDKGPSQIFTADIEHLNKPHPVRYAFRILGFPRSRPHHVILGTGFGSDGDTFEVDAAVSTRGYGRAHDVRNYPDLPKGEIVTYFASSLGELVLGLTFHEDRYQLHRLTPDSKSWVTLPIDPLRFRPMGIDADTNHLWVAEDGGETGFSLRLYHLDTGAMDAPIYSDPYYDIADGHLIFARKSGALAGLHYNQRRGKNVWFDPAFANLQAGIDQLHPTSDNLLISQDETGTKFAFVSYNDRQPGTYLVADLATKKIIPLGQRAPWLDEANLRPTQPFSCASRDGIKLEGYLTLPEDASSTHQVPVVVLVHDGPRQRDTWDYDRDVQFLATRGYAVMRINYRGSAGYRVIDENSWNFEQMEDDIVDATHAIVQTGLVDPKRIAIMGQGVGAYLAVSAAMREPELYHCAASIIGIFDWRQIVKTYRGIAGRAGGYERMSSLIGTLGRDQDKFAALSLFNQIERLKAPIFIAHGEDLITGMYPTVGQAHKFADALRDQHLPVTTFYAPFSADDLYEHDKMADFYRSLEVFLAAQLGGASAPAKP